MTIEKAHLYVEKYSKIQQEILLDFVREDEFLYFKNYGDYTENMHLSESGYEPTMLLLHGCVPMRKLYEGAMITVNMDKLLTLRREMRDFRYNVEDRNQNQPAVVYFEVSDGEGFAELIEARCKILCKRFSTKSRMVLESRADSGLNPLITESHGGQSGMRAGTA